jgi:hypothetical protein
MAKKSKSFWDRFKDSVMSMGDETAGPARKSKPKKAAAKKRSTSKARSKPKKRSAKKRR